MVIMTYYDLCQVGISIQCPSCIVGVAPIGVVMELGSNYLRSPQDATCLGAPHEASEKDRVHVENAHLASSPQLFFEAKIQ